MKRGADARKRGEDRAKKQDLTEEKEKGLAGNSQYL